MTTYLNSDTYLDYLIANCGVRGYDFADRSAACLRPDVDIILRYAALLEIRPEHRVLEVGCGIGRILKELHAEFGVRPSGIDPMPKVIEAARDRVADVTSDLRVCGAERIAFEDASFDRVLCWGVFDLTEQGEALVEMARVIAPGGGLLLTGKSDDYHDDDEEAAIAEERSIEKGIPNHYTDFDALLALAADAGLEVTFRRFFERRGDFMADQALEERPRHFYEYLLVLEKSRQSPPLPAARDIAGVRSRTTARRVAAGARPPG